jgi:hypothetical protein
MLLSVFVLCCQDLLKATVGVWRTPEGMVTKSIFDSLPEDYAGETVWFSEKIWKSWYLY